MNLRFCFVFFSVLAAARAQADAPLAELRERFVQSVLPVASDDVASVHRIAADYARTLNVDGRWPDLRYAEANPAAWSGGKHLERVLVMAKSVHLRRDAALIAKTLAALKAWTGPDAQNPNWWWNIIGVPELVGEIACVLGDDLPPDELATDVKILRRSSMDRMTGANLTWGAINQIVLGCLENSATTVRAACDRLYAEIRLADAASNFEGIQPEFSFHQHGARFYSGGYGLVFANDVGRFLYATWGTPFQISEAPRKIFDDFMLDGMRWMTRGDFLDYSTIGRVIAREGIVAVPRDWSLGPISPAGPAYSLGNVVRLLASLPGPRRADYAEWAARLAGDASTPEFTGDKYFWCSDYLVHRRDGFVTSVKMFSTRLRNGEMVNGEGRKSHHLSDGANFLYVDGSEYRDIFPVWDWQKIPGTTTEELDNMDAIEPSAVGAFGKTDFVGGVGDGRYGLCAMDLRRGQLAAHKAWFFFDDIYVCLGAGITLDDNHDAVTTINQSLLRGDVRASSAPTPLARGAHAFDAARWVHHDRVGYIFPAGTRLRLSNDELTGRWSDVGAGPDRPVTLPVFKLWIDHGSHCTDANYEYFVLPAATASETAQYAVHSGVEVLVNRSDLQAVFARAPCLAAIAFWQAGRLATPLGTIAVDQPCLLLARSCEKELALVLADPSHRATSVHVQIGAAHADVSFPRGGAAGMSVIEKLAPLQPAAK